MLPPVIIGAEAAATTSITAKNDVTLRLYWSGTHATTTVATTIDAAKRSRRLAIQAASGSALRCALMASSEPALNPSIASESTMNASP